MAHVISVGERLHPARSSWPEGAHLRLGNDATQLALFLASPSPVEIRACRKNSVRVGLVVEPPLLLLLYAIEDVVGWSDAPFAAQLAPPDDQARLRDLTEAPNLLQLVLVDATTGIVHALRISSLTRRFADTLYAAALEQLTVAFDEAAYDRALADFYARHRDPDRMIGAASILETAGRMPPST